MTDDVTVAATIAEILQPIVATVLLSPVHGATNWRTFLRHRGQAFSNRLHRVFTQ